MTKIVPIKGKFENAKAMLYRIAEDEEIEEFVVLAVRKDRSIGTGSFNITRANMAYMSVILAEWCRQDDF